MMSARVVAKTWMRRLATCLLPIVVVACGSDSPNATPTNPPTGPTPGPTNPPGTPPPPPAGNMRVVVTPDSVELHPGWTQSFQVTVSNDSGTVTPTPAVAWTSTSLAVASVTNSGVVTGIAVGEARIIATSGSAADTARVLITASPPLGNWVEVQPEVSLQEMTGWEGSAQIGEVECDPTAYASYHQEVLDRLVNELGINRVRVNVRSGTENPVDYYTVFKTTHNGATGWSSHRYESINDNNDPRVAQPSGFQWAEIDHKVQDIINPMRALLQARGERLYVNLNYVDFGQAQAWEQSSDPEEYAELILGAFLHLQQQYGWVPDAVEMVLEPDLTPNWNPQTIGRALVATGDRLRAAGFRPDFIAPSNTNMTSALSYIDQLVSVPRVLEYLTDVAYHRYSGVTAAALAGIAARARQYGLRTAMLEHIGSGDDHLQEDLRDGLNSAWQQFTLAYCSTTDNGSNYYRIDQTVPSSPRVIMNSRTRYFRQYFAFVRLNARRIGAVSGDARLEPLAFRNVNGSYVVVVRSSAPAPVQVRRLPPGTYGITMTTATQTFVSLPDVVVDASGTLQTSIPGAGVMTIHQR